MAIPFFGGKLGKSQPHKAKQRAPTPTPTQQPVAEFKSEFYITRFAAFQNDSYGLHLFLGNRPISEAVHNSTIEGIRGKRPESHHHNRLRR